MHAPVVSVVVGDPFIPALQVPTPHRVQSNDNLHIGVVFTDFEGTKAALKVAANLTAGLAADIDLIVPQVVPFPLSLANPAIPPGFTLRQLRQLAAAANVHANIYMYLCRDRFQTLLQVLEPHSIVIFGRRKRWFPPKMDRLATALRRNGHQVILAPHHWE
jgi:hypothetical protein